MSATEPRAGRIADAFAAHGRRAALMPYLMGGHPTLEGSRDALRAAASSGADLIELGVPFSDPIADGPAIHAAATASLAAGTRPTDVLDLCESVAGEVPVMLMVYANVVLHGGTRDFVRRAADAGAAGLIVPDLPLDEASELRGACDSTGLDLVPLAAPTSSPPRLEAIGREARGFVYTVSLSGTTGERDRLPADLRETVQRVREVTSVPVAVGFGISTAEHVRDVSEIADGVIVGTRVVRAVEEGGAAAVCALLDELGQGLA